jgi:hypothetical protein
MTKAADIVLYDEMGQVLLLAEVKTPPLETSMAWAANVRRDVALTRLNGSLPRFFLVVARDRSYLWSSPADPESLPDVQIPTDELLGDYFRDVQLTAAKIADTALELAVGIWLRDLTHGTGSATDVLPPQLGLATAAENGRIEFATAA